MDLLLRNGTIVNEGEVFKGSIVISGERISRIIREEDCHRMDFSGMEILDMTGLHIFPGVIDSHVHYREPGDGRKGTIESESRASVLGGVTSFMDMPNNTPPALTLPLLEEKYSIAEETSYANYSFYLGAGKDNLQEIKRMNPKDICGVKLFMGSSTGNLAVEDSDAVENIFRYCPTLLAVHCEDNGIISANLNKAIKKYGAEIPAKEHQHIRSAAACLKSSKKAIELAKKHNTRLHVLHITTKEEAEMLADLNDPSITGEACPTYLWFSSKDYENYGNLIKCNPSIKSEEDMIALRKALKDGVLKTVGSDHAPHLLSDKLKPYTECPSGIPLGQYLFQIMLALAKEGVFSLEDVADRTAHGPARCFELKDRGFIREGYYADLAVVDLGKEYAKLSAPASLCGWSPFSEKEMSFPCSVIHTLVNGCFVVKNGELTGDRHSLRLKFDR
ncbi:MAG: dihydroorotase [Bacteroidales bacterium]|nr:dihydroorotase [Bacteroidales bacterium]